MNLQQVFSKQSIIPDLESTEKEELFEEMLQVIVNVQSDINREEALSALSEREAKMTTGIIPSVAVPHCRIDTVRGVAGAIGISKRGIEYDSLDGKPVHFVFMLICNSLEDALHLEVLKDISLKLENPLFLQSLSECKTRDDVYDLLGKSFY
ncbi:MAG: PTS sugar transporter subunit IIA [Treponema sp.]|nr:PTS sugar transporter subunit IIA [Treponema sp.]